MSDRFFKFLDFTFIFFFKMFYLSLQDVQALDRYLTNIYREPAHLEVPRWVAAPISNAWSVYPSLCDRCFRLSTSIRPRPHSRGRGTLCTCVRIGNILSGIDCEHEVQITSIPPYFVITLSTKPNLSSELLDRRTFS